jgi:hypothetical protein
MLLSAQAIGLDTTIRFEASGYNDLRRRDELDAIVYGSFDLLNAIVQIQRQPEKRQGPSIATDGAVCPGAPAVQSWSRRRRPSGAQRSWRR